MPTLSASDYTQYLKFKAASQSAIRPAIQTRDNVTVSQSVMNAMNLTSQAAFVTTPYELTTTVVSATVSAVTSTPVTAAGNRIITQVARPTGGTGTAITYSCSQAHGLQIGNTVSISGIGGSFTNPNPNQTNATITSVTADTFTVAATGSDTYTISTTASIVGRVYYTTSVAHGLVAGDVISVSGVTTFTASNATVLAVPTSTTFALSSTTDGSSVSTQLGTITGLVYYTTSAAHGLQTALGTNTTLAISGLTGTTAFNATGVSSLYRVPSTTVFVLNSGSTGTAITSQTGVLTLTTIANRNNSLRGLARVQGQPPNIVNHPNALSTVSWASGTSGSVGSTTSSKFQQSGGLPANNRVGTYTRIPQNAGWIQGNTISSGPKRF